MQRIMGNVVFFKVVFDLLIIAFETLFIDIPTCISWILFKVVNELILSI